MFRHQPRVDGAAWAWASLYSQAAFSRHFWAQHSVWGALPPLIVPLGDKENHSHVTHSLCLWGWHLARSSWEGAEGCKKMALPQLEAVSALKCVPSPRGGPRQAPREGVRTQGLVIIHRPQPARVSPCSSCRPSVPWVAAAHSCWAELPWLGS